MGRLLAADASHRKGATLKSLTLAPHIQVRQRGNNTAEVEHIPPLRALEAGECSSP